ncbi:MAG: flagellar assembly protein FliH [Steroidobacteraceae bacterium]
MSDAPRATAWVLPQVNGPVVGSRKRADLDAIERQAWDEGYAAGRDQGIEAGRQEQQNQINEQKRHAQRLSALCDQLATPLKDLDNEVVQQLATLAAGIARQVLRRELKTQPEQIIAVIRETLALLPGNARDVRVFLHPADAALVRERLTEGAAERAWSIVEDPVMSRGGCRVQSQNSSIDARLEARLTEAIAAVLGDDRQLPRSEESA